MTKAGLKRSKDGGARFRLDHNPQTVVLASDSAEISMCIVATLRRLVAPMTVGS